MKRSYQIDPLRGVGPVSLRATRSEVHQLLGQPTSGGRPDREMFFSGFFVDYDAHDHVEFIELAKSPEFSALFHGVDLHDVSAEEAISLVQRHAPYDPNDRELGYSYIFPALQLSLWRGVLPAPLQPPHDPTGRHFEAVGIAVPGYFDDRP